MPEVRMYSTRSCPYCLKAERLLSQKGVQVNKILVDEHPEQVQEMIAKTGRRTVPQIFIGSRHIGGFDDLAELNSDGGLDPLLKDN